MKLRIRVTLLLTLVGLIVLAVGTVGLGSYLNARSASQELADQILEQTSLRIDQQVDKLMGEATTQAGLSVRLIETAQLGSHDFSALVRYWTAVMTAAPEITSMYIGLEDGGETVGLSRLQNGRLSVWQTTRDVATGTGTLREYWLTDYPRTPYKTETTTPAPDIRQRPWYQQAKQRGEASWTDTYVFLGMAGVKNVHGVTYAAPIHGAAGGLDAVLGADFDLGALSQYLRALKVGDNGFAFLVEQRDDGSRRVIAHPQPDILMTTTAAGPALVPIAQLADPRVVAFMAHAPAVATATGSLRFAVDGQTYLGSYRGLQGAHMPRWTIGTLLPEDDSLAAAHASIRWTIIITFAALVLAIVLGVVVSRRVARPLETLARDVAAVGHLRLDARPVERSFVLEVDRLALALAEMKVGLRSFQKYLPADLVRELIDSGQEAELVGEHRPLTIYFSDIADFTSHAETMASDALVEHLGDYLGAVNEEILAARGTVDKFIGDAVMAFWNAPARNAGHAAAACTGALHCQRRLRELRPQWAAAGKPAFATRIGLHTGDAIVGNIGSAARMNYTVIGDAVNLASRLEGLNKVYGTSILVSEDTQREAGAGFVTRELDAVAVKGRSQAVAIFELLGVAGEVDAATLALAARYADALAAYRRQAWDEAIAILAQHPDDGPSTTLRARCVAYRAAPPPADWDGVHRLASK